MPQRKAPRTSEQAVDNLIDRPVATMHDDQVDAVADRLLTDLDGVPAMIGVLDGQAHPTFQGMGQQIPARRGRRGGIGVHDQHSTHEPRAYRDGRASPAPIRQ